MANTKKPLLQEGTVRRMMKLANMDALGDGFISEKYAPLEEDEAYSAKKEKAGQDKRQGAEERGAEGTLAKTKGHGRVDYVNEENDEDELEQELRATEDELGAEDEIADEEPEEAEEVEGEVTITDEEAQDIIDLADKLKGAVGGEEEVEAEEEVEIEGPGDEMEMGAEEETLEEPGTRSMYEEELYEAALKGLGIDLVDDKAQQAQAVLQEIKSRVYKRVVNRLLKEGKQPQKPRRKR